MITSFSGQYRFLSNFWPAEIKIGLHTYSTLEHAYQASKTINPMERKMVRMCTTPGKAKRLGQNITINPYWDNIKLYIMTDLVTKKFFSDINLKQLLINTKKEEIVEGNKWGDVFWGTSGGVGENWLGRILMIVRDELTKEVE